MRPPHPRPHSTSTLSPTPNLPSNLILTTPTPAALTPVPYACQAMQRSLDDPHDSERETKRGRKERRRSAGEEAIFTGHARGGSFAIADQTGRSSIVQIRASSARPSPPPPPPGGRRPPLPPDYI